MLLLTFMGQAEEESQRRRTKGKPGAGGPERTGNPGGGGRMSQ